jgi:hypothetical protein
VKGLKIAGILVIGYLGLVVGFESLIGFFQPQTGDSLVLTTVDADGARRDRVLERLEGDDRIYVASNHWLRGWYHAALANPSVRMTFGGKTRDYEAVPVTDAEEFQRIDGANARPFLFKVLTGFPSRYLIRLDPR